MTGEESAGRDRETAELQRHIIEQEEARYSARVLEHARQPRNMGAMLWPDGRAVGRASCGDTMEIFIRLDGPRIKLAVFMSDGCGPTLACGSMLTTMIKGLTMEQAAAVDAGDLLIALDGLPPEHVHCASLAVNTLREAIAHRHREGEIGPG